MATTNAAAPNILIFMTMALLFACRETFPLPATTAGAWAWRHHEELRNCSSFGNLGLVVTPGIVFVVFAAFSGAELDDMRGIGAGGEHQGRSQGDRRLLQVGRALAGARGLVLRNSITVDPGLLARFEPG